jgi:hypothetical protein
MATLAGAEARPQPTAFGFLRESARRPRRTDRNRRESHHYHGEQGSTALGAAPVAALKQPVDDSVGTAANCSPGSRRSGPAVLRARPESPAISMDPYHQARRMLRENRQRTDLLESAAHCHSVENCRRTQHYPSRENRRRRRQIRCSESPELRNRRCTPYPHYAEHTAGRGSYDFGES